MADIVVSFTFEFDVEAGGAISAFRIFRLFRVLKLVKAWKKFQKLIGTIINSIKDVSNFSVLLFLFIFIYTLLGRELFAYNVTFDEDGNFSKSDDATSPRNNFDSFFDAIITIFIVLTGEQWASIMYDSYRYNRYLALFFFISLVMIGQMILLNLFLAILIENFNIDNEDNKKEKEKSPGCCKRFSRWTSHKCNWIYTYIYCCSKRKQKYKESSGKSIDSGKSDSSEKGNSDAENNSENVKFNSDNEEEKAPPSSENKATPRGILKKVNPSKSVKFSLGHNNSIVNSLNKSNFHSPTKTLKFKLSNKGLQIPKFSKSAESGAPGSAMLPKDIKKFKSIIKTKRMSTAGLRGINKSIAHTFDFKDLKEMQKEDDTMSTKTESDLHGRSLCIFGKHNWLRKLIKQIVSFSYFDYFILISIVVSSITLALENPLDDPDSRFSKNLGIMNLTMTIIFVCEFMLKIIATGFALNGKDSYIRNPWNLIDFTSVTISLVGVFAVSNLSVFKVIRVLRLIRPLRVIQRNEGLKVAVQALFMAIPNILYVSMIAVLFFSIFGMTGVNIFKGKFHS